MRFEDGDVILRIRCEGFPTARLRIYLANSIPQGSVVPDGHAEFLGQLAQQVLSAQVAARLANLLAQDFRKLKCWNRATMSAKAS